MKLLFTSNTLHYEKEDGIKIPKELDNTNKIVDCIKEFTKDSKTFLFISASHSDFEKVDSYSNLLFEGLKLSGITFDKYLILDDRTKDKVKNYVNESDVIFLSGGSTYEQNCFFNELGLRDLLKDYDNLIIGQSAGSLNLAKDVYNSPEDGDDSEPIYLEGLNLSELNIDPHFSLEYDINDKNQVYQREHILKESYKRRIYGLCDGSHILEIDGKIQTSGEIYIIENGIIELYK